MTKIRIKNVYLDVEIPEGWPVLIRWCIRYGDRTGFCIKIGWIKAGRRPGTVDVVHEMLLSRDLEETYVNRRTVRIDKIVFIRRLGKEKWCKCPI